MSRASDHRCGSWSPNPGSLPSTLPLLGNGPRYEYRPTPGTASSCRHLPREGHPPCSERRVNRALAVVAQRRHVAHTVAGVPDLVVVRAIVAVLARPNVVAVTVCPVSLLGYVEALGVL